MTCAHLMLISAVQTKISPVTFYCHGFQNQTKRSLSRKLLNVLSMHEEVRGEKVSEEKKITVGSPWPKLELEPR